MASLELKLLTSTQRDNLTASNGMTIYNIDNKIMESYVNDEWQPLNHPTVILTENVTQLISVGTNTQINLSIISVNDNTNIFFVSSSNITVQLSGTYLICGSLVFPSSMAAFVTYFINVNNVRTLESNFPGSESVSCEFFVSAHLHLNSNDVINANVYCSGGTSQTIGASTNSSNIQLQPKLSIELISYS
jgi:hypothetical protein